jgi:hypothetical protein
VWRCAQLRELYLQLNDLEGGLPVDSWIGGQKMNVKASAKSPEGVAVSAGLRYLQVVYVAANKLSGDVPNWLVYR